MQLPKRNIEKNIKPEKKIMNEILNNNINIKKIFFIFLSLIPIFFCINIIFLKEQPKHFSPSSIPDAMKENAIERFYQNDLHGAVLTMHWAIDARKNKLRPFDRYALEYLEMEQLR